MDSSDPTRVSTAATEAGPAALDPPTSAPDVIVAEGEHTVDGPQRRRSLIALAVVSVLVGDPGRTSEAAGRLRDEGVQVGCFRPPSVPDGVSRLRFTARADLTDADVQRAGTATRAVLAALDALSDA